MAICSKRERRARLLTTGLVLALLAASPLASAASAADRAAAREHLTQGQASKKQGQLQEALTHLSESQRLDPKLTTLVELADTEEQLGNLLAAREHWAAAVEQARQEFAPRTRQRAEERVAAIDKRLARLTVQLAADAPAGVQVLRDNAPVEQGSLGTPLVLNPGDHLVVVKLEGHQDAQYPVALGEGDSQSVTVSAGPLIPVAPPPPPPKPAPPPPAPPQLSADSSGGSGWRTTGVILGSLGIVGAGGGAFLWADGARRANSLGPSADRNKRIGQIAVASGSALLVTGVVLFLVAPSDKSQTASSTVLPQLVVDQRTALLGATGAF